MKTNALNSLLAAAVALVLAAGMISGVTGITRAQQAPKSPPAQHQPPQAADQGSTPDMPGMDMGDIQHETAQNPKAAQAANGGMSDAEMDMGPHMFMTDLKPPSPGDAQRAQEIAATLQKSIEKYEDYRVALSDGFKIFLPNLPQKQYHFTNYRNAFVAQFKFDPARPTSLLYKKMPDGYELVGAMFTAPRKATEEQLNERVPLSVARWHKHVNFCLPPKDLPAQQVDWKRFGAGSISTEDVCEQANGRWLPQVFGWMVHVYPFESDPNKVWAH